LKTFHEINAEDEHSQIFLIVVRRLQSHVTRLKLSEDRVSMLTSEATPITKRSQIILRRVWRQPISETKRKLFSKLGNRPLRQPWMEFW